jgi:hypothetical protein
VLRPPAWACMKAKRNWAAVAAGNSDQAKAIAPVTKGAATLVPPSVSGSPWAPRLVIWSPGARNPRRPIE